MANRLTGKAAIVTGAGHGIGKEYARTLASEGAGVALADIDGDAVKAAAAELEGQGYDVIAVQCDIGDQASVQQLCKAVTSRWGRLDVLVNNAAVFKSVPMTIARSEDMPIEEFELMMHVNVTGTWLVCRSAAPLMRQNGYGKIINISSTLGLRAPTGRGVFTHYGASKAAVVALTKWLARELGSDGIRVNAIAPGGTATSNDPAEDAGHAVAVAERAIQRVQRPEDLVGPMLFLATPDSDFVTGQTLVVDGGQYMH
jgi:3-oxoacyl-[acyl-carrier protein] reductase